MEQKSLAPRMCRPTWPLFRVADELDALLHTADVPAPYLLVGHSLGGAYARRFAQRFPDEVCATVLLDPFHEDLHRSAPPEAREKLAQIHSRELPELTDEQLRQANRAAPTVGFIGRTRRAAAPERRGHGWLHEQCQADVLRAIEEVLSRVHADTPK